MHGASNAAKMTNNNYDQKIGYISTQPDIERLKQILQTPARAPQTKQPAKTRNIKPERTSVSDRTQLLKVEAMLKTTRNIQGKPNELVKRG